MTEQKLSNIASRALFRCALVAFGASGAACGSAPVATSTDAGSASETVRSAVAEGPTASNVPHDVDGVRLTLTRTAILLGDDATPVMPLPSREELARTGADVRYKRSGAADLYLVPLANALRAVREAQKAAHGPEVASALIVISDPKTPFRLLLEVLYTAGQSEFGRYHLLVRKSDDGDPAPSAPAVTTAGSAARRSSAAPFGAANRALHLTVIITARGIGLRTSEGNVAEGCEGIGDGVAIPAAGGSHDLIALTACAKRLKSEHQQERDVQITAMPDTDFTTVIGVMDALRGPAASLFPDVSFGVPK